MLIKVKAHPLSSKVGIVEKNKDSFDVYIKEKPERGGANKAAAALLASYFGVPVSQVRMRRGAKTPNKIFEIIEKGVEKM